MVPVEGIEPPCLAARDFESRASTSSATRATRVIYIVAARPANPVVLSRKNLGPPEACFWENERLPAGATLAPPHCERIGLVSARLIGTLRRRSMERGGIPTRLSR
jgi:hypothetical protein